MCVLIFSTNWSETLPVHSTTHCHKCTEVFWKGLVILCVLNLNFLYWCSKKTQKSKVITVQPVWSGSFFEDGQIWRIQYSFLSILRSHPKCTYTKLLTQHPYEMIPWDPSGTSHVENYLVLLNKLTHKGAVRYNIILYSRYIVCGLAVNTYKCRIVNQKICKRERRKVIIYVQWMFSAVKVHWTAHGKESYTNIWIKLA